MTEATKIEWKCTDPVLCTYKHGPYTAQRTVYDQLAVWFDGIKLGVVSKFKDANDIVERHNAILDTHKESK
jgi:hypothetical protein